LIALLLITITTLALKVGQKLWPVWLSEYRKSLIGILVFFVVFLVLLSPIIVAANSNPRPLSGAGQNPYTKNGSIFGLGNLFSRGAIGHIEFASKYFYRCASNFCPFLH
jgi:hypothetical protein